MADTPGDQRSGLTVSKLKEQLYINRLHIMVIKVADAVGGCSSSEPTHIRMALADSTGWIRAKVPTSMGGRLKENSCATIKKFSVKDGMLYINPSTAVYRAPQFQVPDSIVKEAKVRFQAPVHAVMPIEDALLSPPKKKVSVKGKVVANYVTRDVNVRGVPTPVRDIELEDNSTRMRVTLWREATHAVLVAGDEVTLKDVVTSYSTFHKQMTLSVNDQSNIEVSVPKTEEHIIIIGIDCDELEQEATLLCEVDDEDRVLTVQHQMLVDFLGITPETLEELLDHFPIQCLAEISRDRITKLS